MKIVLKHILNAISQDDEPVQIVLMTMAENLIGALAEALCRAGATLPFATWEPFNVAGGVNPAPKKTKG
jgi:hypothetical protein